MLRFRLESNKFAPPEKKLRPGFRMAAALLLPAILAAGQAPDAEARLRQRLNEYWQAMEKEDYRLASTFVHPESRNYFIFRAPKQRYERWKIEKLAFSEDRSACDVAILIAKTTPFGEIFDWPLQNKWVLHEGDWYFSIPWEADENPMLELFRGVQQAAPVAVKTNPEDAPPLEEKKDQRPFHPDTRLRLVADPANPQAMHFGEKAVLRYNYQNTGTEPIRILSVHSDCHCTTVPREFPDVAPGESGTVEVTLDTFGLPLGQINKEVTVQFSDLANPIVLQLNMPNLPNYGISTRLVDFETVPTNVPIEKTVTIVNESGRAVQILSTMNSDPRLTLSLSKNRLERGEATVMTLRYLTPDPGEFMDSVMLHTDLVAEPLINVAVRGRGETRPQPAP